MENISLQTQINSLPANLRQEVRDFVEFLTVKANKQKEKASPRKLGMLKGKMVIAPDFDAPLDDFKEYM